MRKKLFDLFAVPWREQQQCQLQFLLSPESERIDWEVILVLVGAAVAMSLQYYGFTAGDFLRDWIAPLSTDARLVRSIHWAVGQSLLYVLVPWMTIRLILRKPLSDYGLNFRGIWSGAWLYVAMYLIVLPCILLASCTDRFQQTYPFYRLQQGESLWPRFVVWEFLYALQFVALEFFFRGFLVHGLKRRFGVYAIFVMAVPYCMIHFGKPLPETLAAIVAGVALGFMSLKTNSIWPGAAVHIAVAWTMDAAAMAGG
ncbi:MAG: CPBP family intramembrane metalloprotease [Planctomycetes bacterium]|nr:CPBP family intramembrane metalloprotease [Planctomycetota bacterium]